MVSAGPLSFRGTSLARLGNPRYAKIIMRNPVPPLIAIILSITFALGSPTSAAARSVSPADGWVMLCTGRAVAAALVDTQGRPVQLHACTECTTALAAVPSSPPATRASPPQYWRAHPDSAETADAGLVPLAFVARGPPSYVI
jgi:hypothetical protein